MKIDGRIIAEHIYASLNQRIAQLQKEGVIPHLVVVLVGEDPASVAYVMQKQKKGEFINAKVSVLKYDTSVTTEELQNKVKELNHNSDVHGILIQRPLPDHIAADSLELLTDPQKDIDGFHPDSPYVLPVPLACEKILEEVYRNINSKSEVRNPKQIQNTPPEADQPLAENDQKVSDFDIRYSGFHNWLKEKRIAVVGKGPTGGGPVIKYFKDLGLRTSVVDSKTKNPEKILQAADIIIAATGREHMIRPEMIKKGAIVIGVGIVRGKDGKLHGDYDEEAIKDIAGFYTPTPGGVGPVNVAMLWDNLVTAAERQNNS